MMRGGGEVIGQIEEGMALGKCRHGLRYGTFIFSSFKRAHFKNLGIH
jgi:hypothetical protein